MSDIVLKVENLSKLYRLGEVGTGTLSHDLNRWWAKVRGKEDPFSRVGEVNDRTSGTNSKNGYVWSLKDVGFEVRRGDVLGVIGKNGAGKSTLLKLISQITAPTTGCIKAKGRIASLLEVGTGMHPEMTGRENIYLNGTILGMRKWEIDRKFDEIVDFAGCAKYVDTPVKRYSSGMKVRLGFAVAAFLEPEILIVDEVLAVGDAEFQKKAIGKMQEVSRGEGRTVLFVSHNLASIKSLCNLGILLETGRLTDIGEANEIVSKYLNVFDDNEELFRIPANYNVFNPNIEIDKIHIKKLGESQLSLELCLISLMKQEGVAIMFSIRDENENLLFKTSTNPHYSNKLYTLEGRQRVVLTLENAFLTSGVYYIGVGVAIPRHKFLMNIDKAKRVTLTSDNLYGTSIDIDYHKNGYFMIHQNWDISNI